jgi:ABC-type Na+ efflux pump permease subunit
VFDIQTYPTQEAMQDRLREEEIPALGLAIPEGFDRSIETGEALVLQGYVLHWLSTREAVGLRAAVEAEINSLVGKGVQINTAGNVVYLEPESGGLGVQAAMGVVFVLMMIAISLIPHLFMEEKQSRTLEALLVSPARTGEVVVAKALVGLHYGGLGALAALLLNHSLVLHWPLALLTAACGGLFVVSIGLWLGLRVETRAQLGLWTWVLILPLLFPLIIFLLDDLMPAGLVQASRWIPTTMVFNALRASFAGTLPLGTTLLQLGYVLIWTGAILGLVAWQVRSQDRETEASWAQRLRRALAPAWMRRSEQAAAHPVADHPDDRREGCPRSDPQ